METGRSPKGPLRAPLGHWVIAVIFAVAVAWGMRMWLNHQAAQSAQTATLSWDAAVARHQDPGLADAADPAVAMAQSILSDSVVDGLAQSASVPLTARATRIGEFRSRLQLRQPSPTVLQVQFHDANPERAEKATNAVAGSLTAETPGTPAAAAAPPLVETPAPAPVRPPIAAPAAQGNGALVHSLGQLEAELSTTQKKLDSLSSGAWERSEHAGEPSSYRQSKQQQLLTAQVGTSLKEVADWRADPANSGKVQEPLRRIEDALLAVWPASRAWKGARASAVLMGFNAAGVDAGRLREERAQFTQALDVVQKQQAEVQRLESAGASAQPAPPPPSAPPASESSAAAPPASAPAPPIAESEIAHSPGMSPFRLLRPAGEPVRSPVWPAALAGFCGGLVYLGAAAFRYRQDPEDDEEYTDDGASESYRLITPAKPVRPADFFASADPRSSEPGPRHDEAASHTADVVLPPPRIEAPEPPQLSGEKDADSAPPEIVVPAEDQRLPFREVFASQEGEGDPWVDTIIKGLSETSIGRMFESSTVSGREKDKEPETERHFHTDRLAG